MNYFLNDNLIFLIYLINIIYTKIIHCKENNNDKKLELLTLSNKKCNSLKNVVVNNPFDCLIGTYQNTTEVNQYIKSIYDNSESKILNNSLSYTEQSNLYNEYLNREECCYLKANKRGSVNFCDIGKLKENNTLFYLDLDTNILYDSKEVNLFKSYIYDYNGNNITIKNDLKDKNIDKFKLNKLLDNNYTKICNPFDVYKHEQENLNNYNEQLIPCGHDIEITQSNDCFELGNKEQYCCHMYGYLSGLRINQCYMFNKTIGRSGIFYSKEGLTYYCLNFNIFTCKFLIILYIILLLTI